MKFGLAKLRLQRSENSTPDSVDVDPLPPRYNELSACSTAQSLFHHEAQQKLDNASSLEEFNKELTELIRNIWIASSTRQISEGTLRAIVDCIEASKRIKPPIGSLFQFYEFRIESNSLPAAIIFHSLPQSPPAETALRHSLLQTILDEVPFTQKILDELYSACAIAGLNSFYKQILRANLQHELACPPRISFRERDGLEIGIGVRLQSPLMQDVKVLSTRKGFRIKQFVPDFLQTLRSGVSVRTEFVAKGLAWGLYFSPSNKAFSVFVAVLKPFESKGAVRGKLTFSRTPSLLGSSTARLNWLTLSAPKPPGEESKRAAAASSHDWHAWIFTKKAYDRHFQVNKDGGCYLTLDIEARLRDEYWCCSCKGECKSSQDAGPRHRGSHCSYCTGVYDPSPSSRVKVT